jgi:hypothetical protein
MYFKFSFKKMLYDLDDSPPGYKGDLSAQTKFWVMGSSG